MHVIFRGGFRYVASEQYVWLPFHLNKYKIPFAQSNYPVSSVLGNGKSHRNIWYTDRISMMCRWSRTQSIVNCDHVANFLAQNQIAVFYGRNLSFASIWQIWRLVKNVNSISGRYLFDQYNIWSFIFHGGYEMTKNLNFMVGMGAGRQLGANMRIQCG